MADSLQYLSLGAAAADELAVLASSDDMPLQDAAALRQLLTVEPMTTDDGDLDAALALLPYDDNHALLALATSPPQADLQPGYHYLLAPYGRMSASCDGLERLIAQAGIATRAKTAAHSWGRVEALAAMMREGDIDWLMDALSLICNEGAVAIRGCPRDFRPRSQLIRALRALLPAALAAELTFASAGLQTSLGEPHLRFDDEGDGARPGAIQWLERGAASTAEHAYLDLLRGWWQGDLGALAARIERLDELITDDRQPDLGDSLAQLVQRQRLDQQLQNDDEINSADLIAVLTGGMAPVGRLRYDYVKKLLRNALEHREAAAGRQVAEELQRDPELDAELGGLFEDMLEEQPDAVYVFIRNRLNYLGIDPTWIPRMQMAARASLEVAIQDGDVPILISWLELIAHEPLSYELQDILRDGVLASQQRAHADGELGIHLILIAARRLPNIVDELYEDEALIGALPDKMSRALRDARPQTLEALIDETAEYFLLALLHGFQIAEKELVTEQAVDFLWSLYDAEVKINLPAVYQPRAMIRTLATEANHLLSDEALDLLLQRIVSDGDRELFVEGARHLAQRDDLFPRLSGVLEADELTPDQALSILNAVTSLEGVAPRDVVDATFTLLDYYDWEPSTQPMMEALARLMGKCPSLHLSYRHLWKQFDSCNQLRLESATRICVSQLLRQFGAEDDVELVVKGIARIGKSAGWSKALLATMNAWWRDHTHRCNLAHLQKLERKLDGQRHLEAQKQILKTVLAMRRWMHNRDAAAFAAAVHGASAIMDELTAAFDMTQLTHIDPATVRRELDAVGADLSSDERHILANNLRSLAHRITNMAERRSKPSLIRSDDSIDRQLMRGEANPHGSIDMMKWAAGYLDGAHNHSD